VSKRPSTVVVDAVFERFPASIRGAVVIRGADPDPHQVQLERAEVVEVPTPSRPVHRVGAEAASVDVAPRGEVLIPFDVPFAELEPGWYQLSANVVVDGVWRVQGPEDPKRFAVPWPSGTVRRGEVTTGVSLGEDGSSRATIKRVDGKADRAVVRWRYEPPEEEPAPDPLELRVLADGRPLPELGSEMDPRTGERATTTYPVLKAHRQLAFELRPGGRKAAVRGRASLDLP
jgi:hypothetical protein